MASKIVCLVLSLAVICYGYPSGFDDFGNIGKEFGSATSMSEANKEISGALSETKDALNEAGKEISSDPGVKDAVDLFGGFGKAFGGGSPRERPALTTPKSIFDEDNSRSAFERSSDIDSAFGRSSFGSNGFGSNGFGSNSFGSNGFGSSSNFGRRDPFDNGFGSSFGQNRPGYGSSGFGNSGFGSSGGFGGYNNGFGGSKW